MDLRARLELVTERAVLFQVLNDVKENPQNFRNVVESFSESLELFGKFLTPKELQTKLEPVILAQEPIQIFIDFSRALTVVKDRGSFREVSTVLNWFQSSVEHNLGAVILESLLVKEQEFETLQRYREFAKSCANFPEKITNCYNRAQIKDQIKFIDGILAVFKKHLLLGVQSALGHAHSMSAGNSNLNLKTLAELISAGKYMKFDDNLTILYKIMEFIGNIENFDEKWKNIMKELFATPTLLGVQVHEALLTSIFTTAELGVQLERCLPVDQISGTLKRVVLIKLPFQRFLEPWTLKLLVDFVLLREPLAAHELLEKALKLWSDVNFASRALELHEQHLVRLILYLIYRLKNGKSIIEIAWNDLFLLTSNGVYTRVQKNMPLFQRSALFMSQTLSKLAAEHLEHNAPKMEELVVENDTWTEEMREILEHGIVKRAQNPEEPEKSIIAHQETPEKIEKPTKTVLEKVTIKKGFEKRVVLRKIDIPLDSDDDEDEEEFPKYEIQDTEQNIRKLEKGEEPSTSVTPPTYIQDAFEQLLEQEKYEVFEAAFFALPALIRRKAIGFSVLAEQLVLRVLRLPNRFATQKFEETVEEIVVLSIAQRPEIVPNLIRILISPGQGERAQQQILHFVLRASEQMGGALEENMLKKVEKVHGLGELVTKTERLSLESGKGAELQIQKLRNPEIPEWKWEVEKRIASKTRIISKGYEKGKVGGVNRLAQNVQHMFYPLLVVPRGEMSRLLNRDSDLLALIIIVASMVYVRCGVCPTIWKMSTELLTYVRPHRYSENPKVRTACLAAHINVLTLLPNELIANVLSDDEVREWHLWAETVLQNRTENAPRAEIEMASHLATAIYEYFEARN